LKQAKKCALCKLVVAVVARSKKSSEKETVIRDGLSCSTPQKGKGGLVQGEVTRSG